MTAVTAVVYRALYQLRLVPVEHFGAPGSRTRARCERFGGFVRTGPPVFFWQNAPVKTERLASTDGFLIVDLPGASSADGVVRSARKVLADSTKALARSRSYAWALLEQPVSGASVGVDAEEDRRADALRAMAEELAPRVATGELTLAPSRGVSAQDLGALGDLVAPDPASLTEGVLGAVTAALRGLRGRKVAVEHDGGTSGSLRSALEAAGCEVVAEGTEAMTAQADALLFGSRSALLDHLLAEQVACGVLVPTGDLPFTPRALAVVRGRGMTLLPDFLTTAGPLATRAGLEAGTTISKLTEEVLSHAEGPVLGACLRAEDFIATWCPEKPFGRPIG